MASLLENLKDEELMLQFQKGNEVAFRFIVDRHKQRVLNLVFRFLGGYSEAEDIAQDVFVKVYLARKNYKVTARFTTWLYVICKNTCLQALKKIGNNKSLNESKTGMEKEVLNDLPDLKGVNPSEKVIDDERANYVREAIMKLPESQRMVILLRRYDHLNYEEIAEIMNCSIQAVKSLLFRGRVSLKDHLKEYITEAI